MKYVLKNIKGLIKKEPFIFAIMAVCVFVSAWIMCFSYGLYQNYNVIKAEEELPEELQGINPEIAEGKILTKRDVVKYLEAISPETLNAMDFVHCTTNYEEIPSDTGGYASLRFSVRDGKYQSAQYITDLWTDSGMIISGRLISDDEEEMGSNVAMVVNGLNGWDHAALSVKTGNDTIRLFGKEYKVIGVVNTWGHPIIPFLSLPDEHRIRSISFYYDAGITSKQYEELKAAAEIAIPEKLVFAESLPFPDKESYYLYNNIMLISTIIAVLTAINFGALYSFVVNRRKKQLAIFKICGCKSGRAVRIYFGECLLIGIPAFLLGIGSFIPVMKGILADIFPYMEDSYSLGIYGAIFGIYLVILTVIMVILLFRLVKKSTVAVWKGDKT